MLVRVSAQAQASFVVGHNGFLEKAKGFRKAPQEATSTGLVRGHRHPPALSSPSALGCFYSVCCQDAGLGDPRNGLLLPLVLLLRKRVSAEPVKPQTLRSGGSLDSISSAEPRDAGPVAQDHTANQESACKGSQAP